MHCYIVGPFIVGPVTAKPKSSLTDAFLNKNVATTHASLLEALRNYGVSGFHLSEDGRQVLHRVNHYYPARPISFYDGCGDPIPPSVVMNAVADWLASRPLPRWLYRKQHVSPEHFRRLPVPHTGRWGGGGWLRHMRTTQERRAAAALEADEEMVEYGIRPRPARSASMLVDCRDDFHRRDIKDRCWKRHRRTQWR